jgi:hypothetical protein
MSALLRHRYFDACRSKSVGRTQLLEIVKQLYCFSVFFERVITRRIAHYSSTKDQNVLRLAREHLKEEIGHAELFRRCLMSNGLSAADVDALAPKLFTKAMFGYLVATIDHENEYSSNVAIMQVMETIGFHFFQSTLVLMRHHGMSDMAFVAHAADDEHHSRLGLELYGGLDGSAIEEALRVTDDCFRLMSHVLDEWLGEARHE